MPMDYSSYRCRDVLPLDYQSLTGKESLTTSQFFTIPELVADVVDHLVNNGSPIRHDWRRTLADVARVSSVFSRPCLAYIWSELGSWFPLLSLLSGSVQRFVHADGKSITYELVGPVSSLDWERFSYYARFVRVFRVPKGERLSDAAFHALNQYARGAPLLPRLERIEMRVLNSIPDCYARLLHPALALCSLSFPPATPFAEPGSSYDARAEGVLEQVQARAPGLERLHLDIEEPGALTTLSALRGFPNLRALTLHGQVSCAALLSTCAHLPRLATLVVSLPPAALYGHSVPEAPCLPQKHVRHTETRRGFHALESLTLVAPPWYALAVLEAAEAPQLRSLAVFARRDAVCWRRCTRVIAERFARLRDLSLCLFGFPLPLSARAGGSGADGYGEGESGGDEQKGAGANGAVSFAEYFAPLARLRELEDVRLAAARFEMEVSDGDMRAMAGAWAGLRTLFLDVAWKAGTPTPGVRTLGAFAAGCPGLRTLQLPRLSCAAAESETEVGVGGGEETGVTGMSLRDVLFTGERWGDEEAERCERYIHGLFPGLPSTEPRYAVAKLLPVRSTGISSSGRNTH